MGDGGGAGELFIVGRAKGFSLPSLSLLSVSLLNRVQLPPASLLKVPLDQLHEHLLLLALQILRMERGSCEGQ